MYNAYCKSAKYKEVIYSFSSASISVASVLNEGNAALHSLLVFCGYSTLISVVIPKLCIYQYLEEYACRMLFINY